jgi:Spy/CpxP family protein refolding chaperone
MIRNIRWLQVTVAFVLGAAIACAVVFCHSPWGPHRGGKDRFNHMMNRFSRELKLTDDQKKQVAAIFEAKRQRIESIRSGIDAQFEDVRRSTSEEIRKILTPEQVEKFEKLEQKHAEQRRRWRERFGDGPPPPAR